ncbi:MAG: ribosome-associated translation inhibitor RaiA [Lachnospiraceae bacterium]|nr:ribosome-associated translation inhibitor RaiA [Lachnospiraceae bacterium]
MKFVITGRNITVTPGLRSIIEEKLGKLECYLKDSTEVTVTLSVQKDLQKIEVTIPLKGGCIRAEQASPDMYASVDMVEDTIERQLRKHKTRILAREQSTGIFTDRYTEEKVEDDDIKIVRTKRFGIKPMSPEEACLQMELLGHSFYVFSNAYNDEVNVVYKRKDGSFGLIEPTFE